ncbi:MAG: nitroreductase family deazaflavin-dependent oxidoreductase [Sporichthyaceae bacterium]
MNLLSCAKDSAAKVVNRVHPFLVRRTGGRVGGSLRKAPVVLLTTTGRKSGKERTVPLIFLRDGQDVVIVASYGGDDRSPAWFHNLVADPQVSIEIDGMRTSMQARVADPATKARLWPELVRMYSGYASYQKRTEREIPVVLLSPM